MCISTDEKKQTTKHDSRVTKANLEVKRKKNTSIIKGILEEFVCHNFPDVTGKIRD